MRLSHTFVTVDTVVFYKSATTTNIILIKRKNDPFKNMWALPGGFVDENEDLAVAAIRELSEETGISVRSVEQIAAFGKPFRDPRGHTISVAYFAVLQTETSAKAADDAAAAAWFDVNELPQLAFDHAEIIAAARDKANL